MASFRANGFVVLPDLLGNDELDRFRDLVTDAVKVRTAGDTTPLEQKSRYQQSFLQCMNLWEDFPEVAPADVPPAARASRGRAARRRRGPAVARPGAVQAGRRPRDRPAPGPSVLADQGDGVGHGVDPVRRVDDRVRRDGVPAGLAHRSGCASSSTSSSASRTTSSATPRSRASSRSSSRSRRDRSRSTTGSPCISRRRTRPTTTAPCTRSSTSRTAAHAATRSPTSRSIAVAIEVGEVIDSDVTPIVWPRAARRSAPSTGELVHPAGRPGRQRRGPRDIHDEETTCS